MKMRLLIPLFTISLWASGAVAQDETYKPGKSPSKAKPAAKPGTTKPGATKPGATKPVEPKLKDEGKSLFGGSGTPAAEVGSAHGGSWCIVIESFHGDQAEAQAAEGLAKLRTETPLKDAYIEKRSNAAILAYGKYASADSAEARADLEKVRGTQVVIEGRPQRAFNAAFLAPPQEIKGATPEFDLTNAKKLTGDWAIYTLQIGVYSREDNKPVTAEQLAEFRRTAEQAVIQLRREGEQAFYYHGPNRSMVTVGLFGEEDFDAVSKVEGPMITQLRKRYPYNLQNGQGIKHKRTFIDPKTGRQVRHEQIAKSGLVMVPDPAKD